jgi:uncharacterized PurR-regulated membrane protein YhhQ (DUF165 family)
MKRVESYLGNVFAESERSRVTPKRPKTFKGYPFIIAIMACIQVLEIIYGRRFITFFGFTAGEGPLLLLPSLLYIFQIVVECYGWQYSRQIAWCSFFVSALATAVLFVFKFPEYSYFNHNNMVESYSQLIDTMWVSAASGWFCIFLAEWVSALFMSQTRFKVRARFMVLRIALSHCIAELILISAYIVTMPFNGYSWHDTFQIMYSTFIARTISSILMLPLVRVVVWFIQNKVEEVVVFEYNNQYRFLRFSIDPSRIVFFDSQEWNSCPNKKDLDIEKIAMQYNSSYAEVKIKIF